MIPSSRQIPLLWVAALGIAALTAGAMLTANPPSQAGGLSETGSVYILGPARALLSDGLYERADVYFHKGATHKQEVAFTSFFQKWKNAISPTEVQHARDSEILEIMPWLRLATAADPKNIEAYRVAAYWLNSECNKPEAALEVLNEAAEKNPVHYETQLEIGRIHLDLGDMNAAAQAFDQALDLLEHQPAVDPEQAAIDRSLLLTFRSFLYEAAGDADGAVTMARTNMELYPERESLAGRFERLQNEPLNPERAREQIYTIFKRTEKVMECDHGEEHVHGPDCGCSQEEPEEHIHGPDCNHD